MAASGRKVTRFLPPARPPAAEKERFALTTFDKREEGFEAKFAHDQELRFVTLARRNKLLGVWAAGLMGKKGAEAEAYAASLIAPDLLGASDDRIALKIVDDLKSDGIVRSSQDLLGKMSELLTRAMADIDSGH